MGHAAATFAIERRSAGAAWAMSLGAFVFSGSLYLIALTGERWLGMVAPVGGSLMIIGWVMLLSSAVRGK